MPAFDPIVIGRCAVCAFFCVLFIQSGLDKVFDQKGNLAWMTPHFANSPLKALVPLLLSLLTVLELSAGAMCGFGLVMLFFGTVRWATVGLAFVCLALVSLFAGQRIAKDYAGAATIATYVGVALVGLILLAQ